LEDEVHPEAPARFPAQAVGPDPVFVLEVLFGPWDRKVVVASEGLNPVLIVLGPWGQSLPRDGMDGVHHHHVAEEMHDRLGASEQGQIALEDDAVETMGYKNQQAAPQLVEGFLSSWNLLFSTRSWDRGAVDIHLGEA
jgi:hypothetical protein